MSTFVKKATGKTVLDAVIESLNRAASFNRDVQVAPAAILWPDKEGQWSLLAPVLSRILPHYLILGEYNSSTRTGPAIWLAPSRRARRNKAPGRTPKAAQASYACSHDRQRRDAASKKEKLAVRGTQYS